MPEPVTLVALGVAIGKLLLRWSDLNDTADALEDARSGFSALRSLRSSKATDPVGAAIGGLLQQRLVGVTNPHRRDEMTIAVSNVADLFLALSDDDIRAAAQRPKAFPAHLAHGPGRTLLAHTEEAITPFTAQLITAGAEVFAELAPRSERFAPGALVRLLNQLDSALNGVTELHEQIAGARAELMEAQSRVAERVEGLHPKVDAILRATYRPGAVVQASRRDTLAGRHVGPSIRHWDPAALGIHASITVRDEITLTPYLARAHDIKLREHLAEGKESARPSFVLVVGTSCTGKTRTLYEAVRAVLPDWQLTTPRRHDSDLARILLDGVPAHTVVWLDELQDHLPATADGITAAKAVHELLDADGVGPIVFAGTMWPTNLGLMQARPDPAQAATGAGAIPALLTRATVVSVLESFTDDDMHDRAAIDDPRLRAAIHTATRTTHPHRGYKIIQVLAGGPQLVNRLYPPEGTRTSHEFSPAMRAVIRAAGDLRRIGYPNPLPRWAIEGAAPGYLDSSDRRPPEQWLPVALAAVTNAAARDDDLTGVRTLDIGVEGVPALTAHWTTDPDGDSVEAWDLHDYLYQDHLGRHRGTPTRQVLWDTVTHGRHWPGTAWRLAEEARNRGLLSAATCLYRACLQDADMGFAQARLAEVLAARGDCSALDELRERADCGDGYARGRLADHLRQRGDAAALNELWQRVECGDHVAERRLSKIYFNRNDDSAIAELRARSRRGDLSASKWLLRSLARQGDDSAINELRAYSERGDPSAAKWLVRALAGRGGDSALNELEALANAGDAFAANLLAKTRNGRAAGKTYRATLRRPPSTPSVDRAPGLLRARADQGERTAQVQLADLLATRGDDSALNELRRRSRQGDEYARRRLPKALAARGDDRALGELRELAEEGDRHAQEELARFLASRGDAASIEELRSHVWSGFGGMFLLYWLRAAEPLTHVIELDCEAMPIVDT